MLTGECVGQHPIIPTVSIHGRYRNHAHAQQDHLRHFHVVVLLRETRDVLVGVPDLNHHSSETRVHPVADGNIQNVGWAEVRFAVFGDGDQSGDRVNAEGLLLVPPDDGVGQFALIGVVSIGGHDLGDKLTAPGLVSDVAVEGRLHEVRGVVVEVQDDDVDHGCAAASRHAAVGGHSQEGVLRLLFAIHSPAHRNAGQNAMDCAAS